MSTATAAKAPAPVSALASAVWRWWSERRLRLEALPRSVLVTVVAGLVAATIASLLLLAQPFDVTFPGGKAPGPNDALVTRLAVSVVFIGLAVAAACLAQAGALMRRARGRVVVAGIGLAGALLTTPAATSGWLASDIAGWLGLIAGLGLAAAAALGRLPAPGWTAAWAAVPIAASFVAIHLAFVSELGIAYQDLIVERTLGLVSGLAAAVTLLALWAVVEGARAVVGGAMAVTRGIDRAALTSVALIIGIKLVWLALAHLRIAPPELGGSESFVGPSPVDAPVGWLLAAIFGGGATLWLLGGRRRLAAPRGMTAAGWVVIIGLVVGIATAQLLLAILSLVLEFTPLDSAPASALISVLSFVGDLLIWTPAITVLAALFASFVLFQRRRALPAAVFLFAFAIWAAPRAASVAVEEITGVAVTEAGGTRLGGVDVATLDAMFTVGLAVVLLTRILQQRPVPVRALLVALVVSTTVAYGPRLVSPELAIAFWAALVFPVLVQFAFDANGLNEPPSGRSIRTLLAVGIACGSLAVTLLMGSADLIGPHQAGWEEIGRVLMLVPFVALLTASALSLPRRATQEQATG